MGTIINSFSDQEIEAGMFSKLLIATQLHLTTNLYSLLVRLSPHPRPVRTDPAKLQRSDKMTHSREIRS